MAEVQLDPTSTTVAQWSVNSGTAVNAVTTDDSDTTYVYSDSTVGNYEVFAFEDLPADAQSVNSLTYYYKRKKTTTGATVYIQHLHRVSTTYYYQTAIATTTGYAVSSEAFDYQNTSSWTVSTVNSTTYGFRQGNGGEGINSRVTLYYLVCDYTPASGFVFTYCLPLIGILALSSMSGVMKEIAPSVKYERQELESYYNDIKNSQRGYVFMNGIWRK